jgi:tRNA(Glu) U13 pseudouridine synthase TruD
VFGADFDFARTSSLGEGTRRPLRMLVSEMKVEKIEAQENQGAGALRVYFVLPKGAYATTVLGSCMDTVEPHHNEMKDEFAAEAEAPRTDGGNT